MVAAVSATAVAHEQIFEAELSGANEVPIAASPAKGFVRLAVDLDALMMRVETQFSNLAGAATEAHVNCCLTPGGPANVGAATPVPAFPGFPLGVTSGSYHRARSGTR